MGPEPRGDSSAPDHRDRDGRGAEEPWYPTVVTLSRRFLLFAPLCAACSPTLSLVAEDRDAALLSVQGTGPDDVFIVGAPDAEGPAFLQWDGADWTRHGTSAWPTVELWWVFPEADRVTAVGTGATILEWDRSGGSLEVQWQGSDDQTLFGIWGEGETAWAVGGSVTTAGAPPLLLKRDASGWHEAALPAGLVTGVLFKVHGGPSGTWIVGNQGVTLRLDGGTWVPEPLPLTTESLLTVHTGSGEPIAVGGANGGRAYRFAHDTWSAIELDFPPNLNGVCAVQGDVRLVGGQGAVLRASAAGGPYETDEEPLTFHDYHACWLDGDGGFWAVGGHITDRPLVAGVVAYQGPDRITAVP